MTYGNRNCESGDHTEFEDLLYTTWKKIKRYEDVVFEDKMSYVGTNLPTFQDLLP